MSKQAKGIRFQKKIAALFQGASYRRGVDVQTSSFLIECKVRAGRGEKAIVIHKIWFEEVEREAKLQQKIPLLAFRFKNDRRFFVILDGEMFYEIARRAGLVA